MCVSEWGNGQEKCISKQGTRKELCIKEIGRENISGPYSEIQKSFLVLIGPSVRCHGTKCPLLIEFFSLSSPPVTFPPEWVILGFRNFAVAPK